MALADLPLYPWDTLTPFIERAQRHPDGIIDLSVGSPVDPTPDLVRQTLVHEADAHSYPATIGSPALREAVVAWFARRRGVTGLTPQNVIPTIGSKELVTFLPLLLGIAPGDTVVFPRVAYPTYEVGAKLVGAEVLAEDDPARWPLGARLVWINSPGNPDGRVWDVGELRAAVERARELGAVLVADECYAELGWDSPWDRERIPSLLDPRVSGGDLRGLLVAYSLSKQSNLAGYRAAFLAGDEALIGPIGNARKHFGLMVPAPVQAAMVTALGDDVHVSAQKEIYRERRGILIAALQDAGMRIDRSEAGLYLWASEDRDAWESIGRLADLGILAGPGSFYGAAGGRHVRLSLTAPTEKVAEATQRLRAGGM